MNTNSGRAVVTVATGHYIPGAARLNKRLNALGERHVFWDRIPDGCPPHSAVPYAFKAKALEIAGEFYDTLLWADACIYPVLPLDRIWARAEEHGAWISNNGFRNIEWTADDAYPDLGITRAENEGISHVVATAFAISLAHPIGRQIFRQYVHLGLKTRAFVGPWQNGPNSGGPIGHVPRVAPCGPADVVLGHRHDQTALSVLAWRANIQLTSCPDFFAYGKVGDVYDPGTVLLADGGY